MLLVHYKYTPRADGRVGNTTISEVYANVSGERAEDRQYRFAYTTLTDYDARRRVGSTHARSGGGGRGGRRKEFLRVLECGERARGQEAPSRCEGCDGVQLIITVVSDRARVPAGRLRHGYRVCPANVETAQRYEYAYTQRVLHRFSARCPCVWRARVMQYRHSNTGTFRAKERTYILGGVRLASKIRCEADRSARTQCSGVRARIETRTRTAEPIRLDGVKTWRGRGSGVVIFRLLFLLRFAFGRNVRKGLVLCLCNVHYTYARAYKHKRIIV